MSSAFLKNTGGSFEFLLRAGGTAAAAAADVPKAFLNLWPTLGSLCLKRRPAPFSLVLRLLKLLLTLLRALVGLVASRSGHQLNSVSKQKIKDIAEVYEYST